MENYKVISSKKNVLMMNDKFVAIALRVIHGMRDYPNLITDYVPKTDK